MTDTGVRFVQFPHPGGEHNPPDHEMPWNVAGHRRKFLIAPGDYVDADDRHDDVEVVFWGEWEPPSRIERRWPASGRLPRALHRPYWAQPQTSGFRENTDPWVFGDHMIYSVCKQITGPQRRPTSMQRLPRGSVICFGSTIAGEFCIDTVFVVASAEPWVPADAADLDVEDAFKICTADAIATTDRDAHMSLTLYQGATIEQPIEGMFSFVPARRADHDHPRFARPAIQRPEVINPASRQSTWGSKRPLSPDIVRDHWEAIRHQVFSADLGLAVRLATPDRDSDGSDIPDTTRQRC